MCTSITCIFYRLKGGASHPLTLSRIKKSSFLLVGLVFLVSQDKIIRICQFNTAVHYLWDLFPKDTLSFFGSWNEWWFENSKN